MQKEQYQYKAFITCCHAEPDRTAARLLHTAIENYRVPAAVRRATGLKKPGRVFLAGDELPPADSLGEETQQILADSEWLIVVCSPRLPQSRRCMAEIDAFIRLGRQDRILAVLAEGEPAESFPQQLRFAEQDGHTVEIEPLAADLRADSTGSLRKKLKTEKLRLLAPMLGVAFDDLRQRARERRLKMTAAAMACVAALAGAFTVYAVAQNSRIAAERNAALIDQSNYLADRAIQQLETGDAMLARLLALEALPTDPASPDRPLTEAAEQALRRAVASDVPTGSYLPVTTVYADGEILDCSSDKDALRIYSEGYDSFIAAYDIRTGERLADPYEASGIDQALVDAGFYRNTAALFYPDRVELPGGQTAALTEDRSWSVAEGDGYLVAYTDYLTTQFDCEILILSRADVTEVLELEEMTWITAVVPFGDAFLVGGSCKDGFSNLRVYKSLLDGPVEEYFVWGKEAEGKTAMIYSADVSQDGSALLATTYHGVAVFDRHDPQPIWQLEKKLSGNVNLMARFTTGGEPLVAVAYLDGVSLYNYRTGAEQLKLDTGLATVTSIQFNAAGDRLLCGCADSCARIYSTVTGELLQTLPAAGPITAATFACCRQRHDTVDCSDDTVLLQSEDFISIYALADSVEAPGADAVSALPLAEAMELARTQLAGRTLTDEEQERFFIELQDTADTAAAE